MSGKRKSHHSGSFPVASRAMNRAAAADPIATCWRDGLTLDQHPAGCHWTCGHVDDMRVYAQHPSPYARMIDGRLCAPEVSRCNYSHGATQGNANREPHTEIWWTPATPATPDPTRNVTLICGPPGSGKSTLARTLDTTVFDIDDDHWAGSETTFRAALTQLGRTPGAQAAVIRAGSTLNARHQAANLIGATNTIVLAVDPDECIRRVRQRNRPRPPIEQQIAAVRSWWRTHEPDTEATQCPEPHTETWW